MKTNLLTNVFSVSLTAAWAAPLLAYDPASAPSSCRRAPSVAAADPGPRVTAYRLVAARDSAPAEGATGKGWLGVQLGAVPPPLAAQLGREEDGVLVSNVVEGSPADKAGLERYDVITHVDGKPIAAGDVRSLSEGVAAKGAGKSVALTVVRAGEERKLNVVLGERPADDAWDWKFEHAPDSILREDVRSRGRVLQRGPGGQWELHDMDGFDALKDLPDEIRKMLPQGDGMSTRVYVDNDRSEISTKVEKDGSTIEVTQEDGGPITVRRTTGEAGQTDTVEKSYADADELQKADPEAYDAFAATQHNHSFNMAPGGRSFTFNFGDWNARSQKLQAEIEQRMAEAQRSFDEALKRFHSGPGREELERRMADVQRSVEDALKQFDNVPRFWFGQPGQLPQGQSRWGAVDNEDEAAPDEQPAPDSDATPHQSFRVNPDGQIEVHIRKGESELIKIFRDENDLKARDAELFKAYQGVQNGVSR